MDRTAPDQPHRELWVGPSTGWIRPSTGERIDLRRRRPLRRIVDALVHEHERGGGPLDVQALRWAGWPDESMRWDAAVNRIHVALSELRRRGLRPLLMRSKHGYFLDPTLRLRRCIDDARRAG